MTFIWIKKYKNIDGTIPNYFDNRPMVDELYTQRFFDEGFPHFNDEHNGKDDFWKFVRGDFNFKFSLLQSELSAQGNTIKEFLKPQHDFRAKFIVWIQLHNDNILGVIDISTFIIDYTFTERTYDISFKCYSIQKEFEEWCAAPKYINVGLPEPYSKLLTSFFLANLFTSRKYPENPSCAYLNLNHSKLDERWMERLGWLPYIIGQVWNNILDILQANGYELDSGWLYFLDFVQILGFAYKFTISESQPYDDYFSIDLKLYYRDQVFTDWGSELGSVIRHREKVRLDSKQYVILPTCKIAEQAGGNNIAPYKYGGAMATAGGFTIVNDGEYKGVYENQPAFMVIDGYAGSAYNKKITWEGWKTTNFSPVSMDDCKICDVNIFQIHNVPNPLKPWSGQYFFYNQADKESPPNNNPYQFAVSLPRLCVKHDYTIQRDYFGINKHLITDSGWLELLQLSIEQYPFMYIGDKTIKELEIKFKENQIPVIGDAFNFLGYKYFISSRSHLRHYKKTLKLDECIELREA